MMETAANIFLGLFIFGLSVSVISVMMGGGEGHLFHGADGVHGHIGADGVSTGAHGHVGGTDGSAGHISQTGSIKMPFFSITGIMMFLTWFGASGFILLRFSVLALLAVVALAALAGTAGAASIYLFYNKFLLAGETVMRASDYYLPGTLARISSGVRKGGTGEIVYMQGGTTKTSGARSDEDAAHPQGQEVVIVRCENGIAYVRTMDSDLEAGGGGSTAGTGVAIV